MQTGRRKGGQRWQEGTRRPGKGPCCPWGWDGGLAGGSGPIGWGRARAAGGVFQDDCQVGGEVAADPSWPLPGPSSLPPTPRTFGWAGSDWSAPGRQSLFRPYSCPLAWQCVPEQVPAGAGPSGCPMILKGVMLKRKNYRFNKCLPLWATPLHMSTLHTYNSHSERTSEKETVKMHTFVHLLIHWNKMY